jgi:hypothetical protein
MTTDPLDFETNGPWRDGRQLVVRLNVSQLPAYCVKSNRPSDGHTLHVDLEWKPGYLVWVLLLGVIGHFIAQSNPTHRASLDLPVAAGWTARKRKQKYIGWGLVVLGMATLILATIGYSMLMSAGAADVSSGTILLFALGGPLVSVAGAVYLFIAGRPLVQLRDAADDYLWLSGVHPEFLARFPPWKA